MESFYVEEICRLRERFEGALPAEKPQRAWLGFMGGRKLVFLFSFLTGGKLFLHDWWPLWYLCCRTGEALSATER